MEDSLKAPAGWYPDSSGGMRYWDGGAWTDYTSDNYWALRGAADSARGSGSLPARDAALSPLKPPGTPLHRKWQTWAVAAVLALAGVSALDDADQSTTDTVTATSDATESPQPTPPAASGPAPTHTSSSTPKPQSAPSRTPVVLLFITDQKDGDSFVASDGNEYRLGLVNTAEASEPCGSDAARFTRDFLAGGFTVDAYSRDTYGRRVAEVFDRPGRSLNVALAKSGYGNDRYLNDFRHENPELARRLDAAFASADTPSCSIAAPAPLVQQPAPAEQSGRNCMNGYDPCLPIRGDMNCPDIGHPVRVTGSDPYGLDRDGDGVGCD